MDQRGTESRGAAQSCRDTGDHLDLHRRVILRHLINESCHAVYSRIAAADKSDVRAVLRFLQGKGASLLFPAHGCRDDFFVREAIPDKVDIDMISGDHITLFDRPVCLYRHLINLTGSHTDNNDLPFSGFSVHVSLQLDACSHGRRTQIYMTKTAHCGRLLLL